MRIRVVCEPAASNLKDEFQLPSPEYRIFGRKLRPPRFQEDGFANSMKGFEALIDAPRRYELDFTPCLNV
jgi:hypothetical protein